MYYDITEDVYCETLKQNRFFSEKQAPSHPRKLRKTNYFSSPLG